MRRGDRAIVLGGVREGLHHQPVSEVERRPLIDRLEHRRIVGRITTTSTWRKFFAAARTRLGPPMSICSTSSSRATPGFFAVSANG